MGIELIGFGRKCQFKSESLFQFFPDSVLSFVFFFLNTLGSRTEPQETVGRDNGLKLTSR